MLVIFFSVALCFQHEQLTNTHSFSDPPVEYAVTTMTDVLCSHLEKFCAFEYTDACKSHGWVKTKSLVRAANDDNAPVMSSSPQPPFSVAGFKAAWLTGLLLTIRYVLGTF